MKPMLDSSAALAPATARFEHQRNDARQQRWMAQLEQAMLAQAPAEPQAARVDADSDIRRDGTVARARELDPAPAAPAQRRPAERPQAHAAAQDHLAQGPRAPVPRGGEAGGAADSSAAAHDGAAPAITPAIMPGTAPGAARGPVSGIPNGLPSGTPVGLGALAAAQAARTTLAPSVASPATPIGVSDTALTPMGAASAPAFAAASLTSGALAVVADAEAAASGAPETAVPGEEYHKQLLHLFHGADGVQAYIRDAALDGARLRLVAQALAAELNGSGARLAGLTVNGRRVGLGGPDGPDRGSEHDEPAPATASGPVARPVNLKGAI